MTSIMLVVSILTGAAMTATEPQKRDEKSEYNLKVTYTQEKDGKVKWTKNDLPAYTQVVTVNNKSSTLLMIPRGKLASVTPAAGDTVSESDDVVWVVEKVSKGTGAYIFTVTKRDKKPD
jgi:hypothetical protein